MAPLLHGAAATIGRRGWAVLFRTAPLNIRATSCATANAFATNANRYDSSDGLTHSRIINNNCTQQTALRYLSSTPAPPPNTNLTEVGDGGNKGIFGKLWDRYSFEGQTKRIVLGERLFRSAQYRANDPRWFQEARIPYEFRPRHALLTMHVWFLHKRLLADRVDSHLALLVQEELFDILWNDTRARIRAEGVNELTVNKHLKDAQQLTFLHCTHYDHAFQEFASDDKRRFEEIAGIIWTYVLNKDEEAYHDQVKRLATYVEYQYANLLQGMPDSYFWEGRIPWGSIPDFKSMKDNDGKELEEIGDVPGLEILPEPWMKTLTDAGDTYYWNPKTDTTTWSLS